MGGYRRTVNELRVTSNGFLQCLDSVERASGWKGRFRKMGFGRGLGVAGSCYITGTNYPIYPNQMPQSAVQIQVDRSGRVTVFSGASDTDLTPVDLGAYSSRVTFMMGNACIDAARKLKKLVQEAVAEAWEIKPGRVLLAGGLAMDGQDT